MSWYLLRITVQNRWTMYLGESSSHSVSVDTKHHAHITQLKCRPWWHLIFEFKNRFITILTVFCSESRHEVAPLGSKVIGFRPIHVKYINFLMLHAQHVFSSYRTETRSRELPSSLWSVCWKNDVTIVSMFTLLQFYTGGKNQPPNLNRYPPPGWVR